MQKIKNKTVLLTLIGICISLLMFSLGATVSYLILKYWDNDKTVECQSNDTSNEVNNKTETSEQISENESDNFCSQRYFVFKDPQGKENGFYLELEKDTDGVCSKVYKISDLDSMTPKIFYDFGDKTENLPLDYENFPFLQYKDQIILTNTKEIVSLDQEGNVIKKLFTATEDELFTTGILIEHNLYFGVSNRSSVLSPILYIKKLDLTSNKVSEVVAIQDKGYSSYPMYPGTTVHVLKVDDKKQSILFNIYGVEADGNFVYYYTFNLTTKKQDFLFYSYSGIYAKFYSLSENFLEGK